MRSFQSPHFVFGPFGLPGAMAFVTAPNPKRPPFQPPPPLWRQIRVTRSLLVDTIFWPSGDQATDVTRSEWPSNTSVASHSPLSFSSQIRTVLSCAPVTTNPPSGDGAADVRLSLWPSKRDVTCQSLLISSPDLSQMIAVRSLLALRM